MIFFCNTIRAYLCRLLITTTCAMPRQIPTTFSSFGRMNLAQKASWGSSSSGRIRFSRFGSLVGDGDGPSRNALSNDRNGYANNRNQMSQKNFQKHQSESGCLPDFSCVEEFPALSLNNLSTSKCKERKKRFDPGPPEQKMSEGKRFNERKKRIDRGLKKKKRDVDSPQPQRFLVSNNSSQQDDSSFNTPSPKKGMPAHFMSSLSNQSDSNYAPGAKMFDSSDGSLYVKPFDICQPGSRNFGARKASLHTEDKENHFEMEPTAEERRALRPGMVLLKHYITLPEQIEIVKTCQKLGMGPGGFYQPGYKDGAKLRLQMMCFGLNWDPETKYEELRSVGGCEPPEIPHKFSLLVQRAIQDAHNCIKRDSVVTKVDDILPAMSPDICIVNFYTISGRLGLHQDRDETEDSRRKGLPVVSFSIGDSAEFCYGDTRNVDKAEKVILESGDVLIFGGESRHVYHGVSSILRNSAPIELLEKSKLRPGRLNLTFRKY